jgi:uncharacterized membrane-anchored protein YhcB (DUF1043 family)
MIMLAFVVGIVVGEVVAWWAYTAAERFDERCRAERDMEADIRELERQRLEREEPAPF